MLDSKDTLTAGNPGDTESNPEQMSRLPRALRRWRVMLVVFASAGLMLAESGRWERLSVTLTPDGECTVRWADSVFRGSALAVERLPVGGLYGMGNTPALRRDKSSVTTLVAPCRVARRSPRERHSSLLLLIPPSVREGAAVSYPGTYHAGLWGRVQVRLLRQDSGFMGTSVGGSWMFVTGKASIGDTVRLRTRPSIAVSGWVRRRWI